MSLCVLLQISWVGGTPGEVVPIAEKHYNALNERYHLIALELRSKGFREGFKLLKEQPSEEAIKFLKGIRDCRCHYEGTKGTFWSWGTVGNCLIVSRIVKELIPFFHDLYSKKVLVSRDRIIALSEREDAEAVEIILLRWTGSEVKIDTFRDDKWFWGV